MTVDGVARALFHQHATFSAACWEDAMADSAKPARIFISYAREDEDLRKELEKQLAILRRQGLIETWHDRRIGAGAEWAGAIDRELEAADIVLLSLRTTSTTSNSSGRWSDTKAEQQR